MRVVARNVVAPHASPLPSAGESGEESDSGEVADDDDEGVAGQRLVKPDGKAATQKDLVRYAHFCLRHWATNEQRIRERVRNGLPLAGLEPAAKDRQPASGADAAARLDALARDLAAGLEGPRLAAEPPSLGHTSLAGAVQRDSAKWWQQVEEKVAVRLSEGRDGRALAERLAAVGPSQEPDAGAVAADGQFKQQLNQVLEAELRPQAVGASSRELRGVVREASKCLEAVVDGAMREAAGAISTSEKARSGAQRLGVAISSEALVRSAVGEVAAAARDAVQSQAAAARPPPETGLSRVPRRGTSVSALLARLQADTQPVMAELDRLSGDVNRVRDDLARCESIIGTA